MTTYGQLSGQPGTFLACPDHPDAHYSADARDYFWAADGDEIKCGECGELMGEYREVRTLEVVTAPCGCEGRLHYTSCWWCVGHDDGRDQATGDPAIDEVDA